MNSEQFKSIITNIIQPKLASLGYNVENNPPGSDENGDIWFEKTLREGIFVVIHFQPRFLNKNEIVDFAVNLARNSPSYDIYRNRIGLSGYWLDERLASWLWIDDRSNPEWRSDYWWHFLDETELENSCFDILDKLLNFGIPFLEDLDTKSPKMQQ